MWHLLAGLMAGNAVWFLVNVVATLLSFNMTSNAYKSGQAPFIGKKPVSLYCSRVSPSMCTPMFSTNGLFRDVALGLSTAGKTGELSGAAQAFIAQAADVPSMKPMLCGVWQPRSIL